MFDFGVHKLATKKFKAKAFISIGILLFATNGMMRKNFTYEDSSYFHSFFTATIGKVQNGLVSTKFSIKDFLHHYVLLMNASIENDSLRFQLKELGMELDELKEIRQENIRLKALLKFGEEIQREKVLARIIGKDVTSDFKSIRINKGLKDGIRLKSPVISFTGLVGHVYRVNENSADILTILDKNNRVSTLISRTRSHGIIEGISSDTLVMKYVVRTEPVKINDSVVTSGLGEIYPKGVQVGKVIKIEKENYGITQFVEVGPSVDFNRLEEVVVLLPSSIKDVKINKEQ